LSSSNSFFPYFQSREILHLLSMYRSFIFAFSVSELNLTILGP
jgi:hypothetical protein